MSFRIRAARASDLDALYNLAKLSGGGMTNLPADRPAIEAKLRRSAAAFAREDETIADDLFIFVLEHGATGDVRGTCQIFSHIGRHAPFYSYRMGRLTQHSRELNRLFQVETMTLCTDLEGSTEVGGLFLHPGEQARGLGALIARSRYLFIRSHRRRFADLMVAELRGVVEEDDRSPFWDCLGANFFGMSFTEADSFNARHGNQFIADLMPKHPIYVAMLPQSARTVIGIPHRNGRAAMRMLERENFSFDRYIDIFDGGPTMTAETARVRTIAEARDAEIVAIADGGEPALVAAGRLASFGACLGRIDRRGSGVALDGASAELLGVNLGDVVSHVA